MALSIVLIDKSKTVEKVLHTALYDLKPEVTIFQSSEDVVDLLVKSKPDLIFIDTLITPQDGYALCSTLKDSELLSQTPVVLLYNHFSKIDEDLAQKSNANAWMQKPFDLNALREQVFALLPQATPSALANMLSFKNSKASKKETAPTSLEQDVKEKKSDNHTDQKKAKISSTEDDPLSLLEQTFFSPDFEEDATKSENVVEQLDSPNSSKPQPSSHNSEEQISDFSFTAFGTQLEHEAEDTEETQSNKSMTKIDEADKPDLTAEKPKLEDVEESKLEALKEPKLEDMEESKLEALKEPKLEDMEESKLEALKEPKLEDFKTFAEDIPKKIEKVSLPQATVIKMDVNLNEFEEKSLAEATTPSAQTEKLKSEATTPSAQTEKLKSEATTPSAQTEKLKSEDSTTTHELQGLGLNKLKDLVEVHLNNSLDIKLEPLVESIVEKKIEELRYAIEEKVEALITDVVAAQAEQMIQRQIDSLMSLPKRPHV